MKIIIHSRHADLADDFSQIVEEKIHSLERSKASNCRLERFMKRVKAKIAIHLDLNLIGN